jgi:hypothetical protein
MKKLNINAIALAFTVAFSASAMAEGVMAEIDFKAAKEKIAAEYKLAKAGCSPLSGNTKDICVAAAKGNMNVAEAELHAGDQPSLKASYEVSVARAEADYAVANERCDDKGGNIKDVCVKEAKAAQAIAKADAMARMKSADAKANIKAAVAYSDAEKKTIDAQKDATEDKVDARYAVAKEKCDTFSGSTKDSCLSQAKANFGQ